MPTYLVVLLLDTRTSALVLGPLNAAGLTWLNHNYETLDALMRLRGLPIGYVEQPEDVDAENTVTLSVTQWLTGSLVTIERLLTQCRVEASGFDAEARSRAAATQLDVLEQLQAAEQRLKTALQDYVLLETY